MKYGIYYAYWEQDWQADYLPYIEKAAKLGFDCLETACTPLNSYPKSKLVELRQAAADHGIFLTAGHGPSAMQNLASADPAEFQMRQSLKNDPQHRMALEFLAAEYMGYKNHAGIIGLLPAFRAQNYSRLPRHIEEVVCIARQEDPAFSLSGYTISPGTEARFQHFRELYSRNAKADSMKIFETLAPAYGDTYWFYHLFSMTGSLKLTPEEEEEE